MSFSEDFFEKSELDRVGILDEVSSDGVEGGHVHVAVGVEVVDKLDLVDVREDEVSHRTGLWLREGEGAGEGLRARVFFAALVSVGEAIVAIEVDSSVSVVPTEPFSTPAVISVLALHHVVGSLEECLLDIEDTIDIEDRDDVEGHVFEQVNVVLVVVDDSVQELENNVEGHLD